LREAGLSVFIDVEQFRLGEPVINEMARGVEERPVRADRIRKSLGAENTFSADIFTFVAACEVLQPIIEKVWRTCEGAEIRGRTVTLKVKYADFQQITRSRTGPALFSTRAEIEQLSYALLEPLFPVTKGIRLLGMTLSSLGEKHQESEPPLSLSF
jgi:DNA polymerase-4